MADPSQLLPVRRQPGDGADRAGQEEEAVGEPAPLARREPRRELHRHHHAGEVVVGERRVAAVGREQDLFRGLAGEPELAEREAAGEELGIDDHIVLPPGEALDQPVGEAEAPLLLVVAGAVGNQVGLVGKGEEMAPQLFESDPAAKRGAVVEQLQVVSGGVGDPPAVGRRDVGLAEAPLAGHRPVEDRRAGGDLVRLEGDPLGEDRQALADAVAGNAARNREEARGERVQFGASHRRGWRDGRGDRKSG